MENCKTIPLENIEHAIDNYVGHETLADLEKTHNITKTIVSLFEPVSYTHLTLPTKA